MLCYRDNFMSTYSAFSPYRLMRRETGFGVPVGNDDAIARSLYCGMKPIASWDSDQANALPTGGVFNLEFSPEGSLLVAACEKKSIQIFDPLTHQRVHHVNGAHSDCVNCVKFLDARMFATCSDDTTIALWDVRNLKKKMRSLHGHSNWVKNIEFSVKDKLLVTSGLDGSIYTWDINSYTEYNLVYQRVFHASGLMRCRLSPDAKQMVMCTTGGLLVIIHDLNLSTLASCLHGFKPNLYRLMQMSRQLIPIAAMYDHLFDTKREENRVEFVSDFPEGNDAEVLSSLQIHPQGWSALSRNISHGDRSEWTCIHDIQPSGGGWDKSVRDVSPPPPPRSLRRLPRPRWRPYRPPRPLTSVTPATPAPRSPEPEPSSSSSDSPPSSRSGGSGRARRTASSASVASTSSVASASSVGSAFSVASASSVAIPSTSRGVSVARSAGGEGAARVSGTQLLRPSLSFTSSIAAVTGIGTTIQNDVWEASVPIKQHRLLQDLYNRGQAARNINVQRITGITSGITSPRPPDPPEADTSSTDSNSPSTSGRTPPATRADSSPEEDDSRTSNYIRQNRDRLLYYIEETNEGRGFIKELCYSADGRLVCSPFGRGMRLLALNEKCSELSHCVQDITLPQQMIEIGQSLGVHQDLVVSSKFSPRHHLLVTGCLEGKIVWYEPYSGENLY